MPNERRVSNRVHTLLSTSNFMTFHDFFHDLFKFFKTLGLAVRSKNVEQLKKTLAFTKIRAVYAA